MNSMNTEKSKKKKTVLLIEDKLASLQNVLLSIQTLLLVANKQKRKNAPQDNEDTQVFILHIVQEETHSDFEHFNRLKRILQEREASNSSVRLCYEYKPFCLDITHYPKECEKIVAPILAEIDKICKETDFSILLDAILLAGTDDRILVGHSSETVLSQAIYKHFKKNCIPYTNYGEGTRQLRTQWKKGMGDCQVFQRQQIVGHAIYKPFQDVFYKQLNIEDET